jgi:DNA-binding NtrC family response regulator
VELRLPALRDRREDIPPLANHFLRRQSAQYRKVVEGFSPDAMQALLAYEWPGNIRELEHTVERAVLLAHGDRVEPADLNLRSSHAEETPALDDMALEDVERLLIQKALKRYGGNVSQAAEALGLSRSALYRRLQRFGL